MSLNKSKRIEILEILSEHYAGAKIELNYENNYQLLVAVLLSAQATDIGVNKATEQLFKLVKTPEKMLALGLNNLKQMIKQIGLYHTKAKHVIALSDILVQKHQGEVPNSREALEALPGVGRKTCNVVLNEGFGFPEIAVDTHIFRVCNRAKFAIGKTPDLVELKLQKVVPNQYKKPLHQWLIQLGRYTCVARRPKCNECPIRQYCEYSEKVL